MIEARTFRENCNRATPDSKLGTEGQNGPAPAACTACRCRSLDALIRKHFQFLTEDVGDPHVNNQITAVTTLLRATPLTRLTRPPTEAASTGAVISLVAQSVPLSWRQGQSKPGRAKGRIPRSQYHGST